MAEDYYKDYPYPYADIDLGEKVGSLRVVFHSESKFTVESIRVPNEYQGHSAQPVMINGVPLEVRLNYNKLPDGSYTRAFGEGNIQRILPVGSFDYNKQQNVSLAARDKLYALVDHAVKEAVASGRWGSHIYEGTVKYLQSSIKYKDEELAKAKAAYAKVMDEKVALQNKLLAHQNTRAQVYGTVQLKQVKGAP